MFSLEQYRALHEGAGLLDRGARGRLQLTGQDRRDYLHGLLTNDIAALEAGTGCYAALLTPQGRMISDMRVSELGDRILIDLPARASELVRQRLADFIFSEDVEVTDVRDSLAHLAIYGPRAASVLTTALDPTTDANTAADRRTRLETLSLNQNATWDAGADPVVVVRSEDYGIAGFEVFVGAAGRDDLVRRLHDAGSGDLSLETAAVSRIEAGLPEFGADMDEHTIPLEAGIDERAISLTKGCYVGQEVIIRVLHRGQGRVARRLVGFIGAAESGALDKGERLLDADGVKDIGFVTSAVVSPRVGRPIGLGYVHRDYAEPGTLLRPAGGDGGEPQHLTVVATPFTPKAAG